MFREFSTLIMARPWLLPWILVFVSLFSETARGLPHSASRDELVDVCAKVPSVVEIYLDTSAKLRTGLEMCAPICNPPRQPGGKPQQIRILSAATRISHAATVCSSAAWATAAGN